MTMTEKLSVAEKRWRDKFEKTFGRDTLEMDTSRIVPYEVIPTGSMTLDYMLSVGGMVEGRIAEFWGSDGVGKTTFALLSVTEAQRKYPKKRAAWIDMEHKLDKQWAKDHGVDMSRFTVYTPDNAEDVADAMKDIVRAGFFSIVVLDSIGGMIPEIEKEKDADEAVVGLQAKIVTRMVKIAATEAKKTGIIVVLINQIRANIGGYGADTTTGGGWALRYSTTHKFKFKRTGTKPYQATIAGELMTVGHEVAVEIQRNGVAPAYRTAIFNLMHIPTERFGPIGVDKVDEATTIGIKLGVIHQNGGWYTLPGTGEQFNGRDKLVDHLRDQPEAVQDLRERILATRIEEVHEEIPPEEIPDPSEDKPNGAVATKKKAPAKKAAKKTTKAAAKGKPAFRRGSQAADPELR